jgi:Ca-activated chloride channel family protein
MSARWFERLQAVDIATAMETLKTFQFGQPMWLLLIPLAIYLGWRWSRPGSTPAVVYSSLRLLEQVQRRTKARRSYWFRMVRVVALGLIIVALAQPRVEKGRDDERSEGIDIILVLDASRSMDSKDFDFEGRKVSRRAALEAVIGDFIKTRTRDRIGIVGFAERPFLISPLTLDHSWMMEALAEMQTSLGTAIGSAVEAAVDLLRGVDTPNKIIIAVTDGLNTSGVDPLQSARTVRRFGVRLYTVGVVSYAEMRTRGLDNVTLNGMARMTGGQFFQASDGGSLKSIYAQIDQLEKREFKQSKLRAYRELYPWFAAIALALLLLNLLFTQGRRMRLP